MKKSIIITIGIILIFAWKSQPSQGMDTGWDAWLYEPLTRHVWNVDDTGAELVNLTLPIPDIAYSNMVSNIGVSHNGRYIAYFAQHNVNFDYQFLLYDITERTMFSGIYRPPTSGWQRIGLEFGGGHRVFSPDDRYLAIGYQTDFENWEVHVIDMLAEPLPRITHSLRNTDPNVAGLRIRAAVGVPVIQQITGTRVRFSYLDSMEGFASLESYEWDFTSGVIFQNTLYPNLTTDLLPATDETISSYQNESYANRLDRLEYPLQYNIVEAYYPPYGNFVYYNNPDVSVNRASFVQNGVRILIEEYEYDTNQTYLLLRERSGFRLDRVLPTYQYNSLKGMTTGFLMTATNIVAEGRGILLAYDTQTGTARTFSSIWNAPVGEYPRIMAVNNHEPVNPASFAIWGEHLDDSLAGRPIDPVLGVPPVEATVTPSVGTGRPIAAGDLVVGGRARVFTTEGDSLNMRSGPGTSFAIVSELALDTRVTVLEGPVSADGLQWWRVQTDDARTGWAVDFVDSIPTLIPE